MAQALAPITLFVLRHLRTHGITPLKALKAARAEVKAKTLANLAERGHVARHDAGYGITAAGRIKLASVDGDTPANPAAPAATPTQPQGQPMLSNAEVETAITTVLQRARGRVSMHDISRRTNLADHIVRPTLTTMVQQGKVEATTGKPALYRLAVQAERMRNTHAGGGPRDHLSNFAYTCPELARNPGIGDERFAAYELPSRMGDHLHYPDGRVEAFPNMREVAAA